MRPELCPLYRVWFIWTHLAWDEGIGHHAMHNPQPQWDLSRPHRLHHPPGSVHCLYADRMLEMPPLPAIIPICPYTAAKTAKATSHRCPRHAFCPCVRCGWPVPCLLTLGTNASSLKVTPLIHLLTPTSASPEPLSCASPVPLAGGKVLDALPVGTADIPVSCPQPCTSHSCMLSPLAMSPLTPCVLMAHSSVIS
jgi:hypothetical protein